MDEKHQKMTEMLELLLESSNLTRRQLLMWYGHQKHGDIPLYSIPFLWRFEDDLNYKLLKEAFQQVVDHNAALRTVFQMDGGIPTSKIRESLTVSMELVDLSDESDADNAIQTWAKARIESALNIETQCFDTAFIKLNNGCAWFLNEHHLITDGRSKQLVFEKTGQVYEQLSRGVSQKVTQSLPFSQYVEFERKSLAKRSAQRSKDYWSSFQSDHTEGPLYPLGADASTHCERRTVDLAPGTLKSIADLGNPAEGDLTIVSTLISVLVTQLHQQHDRSGITLGHTVSKRPAPAHQDIIGLCLEIAPLHVELDENESYGSLRLKVMKQILDGMRHLQHLPWNYSEKPIYDVLFNYLNLPFPDINSLKPLTEWIYPCHQETALNVQVLNMQSDESLQVAFDFRKDAIAEPDRAPIVDGYLTHLKKMLEDPSQPLAT